MVRGKAGNTQVRKILFSKLKAWRSRGEDPQVRKGESSRLLRAAGKEKHFPAQSLQVGKSLGDSQGEFSSVNQLYVHG